MSRAGSDIGYCDSDYRDNNTTDNNPSSSDIEESFEKSGCTDVMAITSEHYIDEISFVYEGIFYRRYDLEYSEYDNTTFQDFMIDCDETESACCGGSYCPNERICNFCEEKF